MRSRNMAAIRSKDTKPEQEVRRALHAAGYRFRLRPRKLPGRADVVLPRYRQVVFVHGCFWHGHNCRIAHTPKTNIAYWSAKIERNVDRDAKNQASLERDGWEVATIWECMLDEGIRQVIAQLDAKSRAKASSLESEAKSR